MKCTRFFVGIGVILCLIICFVSSLILGPDVDVDVPEADIVVAAALPTLETAPPSVDVKGVKLHAPMSVLSMSQHIHVFPEVFVVILCLVSNHRVKFQSFISIFGIFSHSSHFSVIFPMDLILHAQLSVLYWAMVSLFCLCWLSQVHIYFH